MKRTIAILLVLLGTLVWTGVPSTEVDPTKVAMVQNVRSVMIDHLSSTRTSDGTTMAYCIVKNTGQEPVTSLHARVVALNDSNEVVHSRTLVLFDGDTLPPQGKAIFTSSFEECWDCSSVTVALY